MELKDRLSGLVRALPPAQRTGIVVAVLVLVMAAVPFARWLTAPSYAVLFAGMADQELAQVIDELDSRGVAYQLEGNRVLVPQPQLHRVRAELAQAGVSATPTVPGYELLDDQALGVSDFRQRVDLQRAVEGELAKTLSSFDGVESATVRLVLPEDSLFTEAQTPATASVLVRPSRELDAGQIEAITLLVSSAVEGLDVDQVTVADTAGRVLHAPGDGAVGGGVTDRQQRRTREFEHALAQELTDLLQRATNAPASVVVRADLDFDEVETQTETYDADGTPLREASTTEAYEGNAPVAGGVVGVDGGPLQNGGGDGTYDRTEESTEYGVGRSTTRTVRAPGTVEGLSVAMVVDEGAAVADAELTALVTAAAGLVEERGDSVALTRVTTPAVEELPEEAGAGVLDLLPRIVALVVLALVAVGLFLMARRRRDAEPEPTKVVPAQVRPNPAVEAPGASEELPPAGPSLQDEVSQLVEKQPEEIATLLRGWLADRRTSVR
ncbi:flagellar M-ring protein FliF [Nitriliruptoraceae bacterium ZYF776]|nr:flagellar M-ring protein FliF [Profundirhabdus halotolerans]